MLLDSTTLGLLMSENIKSLKVELKTRLTGRTNLVVKYSIVVGSSTVRFCGLALNSTRC
jgi:hypothetical protein